MADPRRAAETPSPTSPWVKLLGLGLILAILVVVVVLVVSGGAHGPWQHGG